MGYAIAERLAECGANVILVSGPVEIKTKKKGINLINVESADEMYHACVENFPGCIGTVMTAAVSDFTPVNPAKVKTKRGNSTWTVDLKPTRDIASTLGKMKRNNQLLVGFALETNNELENAKKKLKIKNLDLIVLNSLNDKGAGFRTDTNKITLIDKYNNLQSFELKSKKDVAHDIVEKILSLMDE